MKCVCEFAVNGMEAREGKNQIRNKIDFNFSEMTGFSSKN